jgi:hypothetical protein
VIVRFWPILLKNSVLKIVGFSFAICSRFRIVSWRSSVRLTKATGCAQDRKKFFVNFGVARRTEFFNRIGR